MDVHKETISISVAEEGRNGPAQFIGVIPNQPDEIAKMAKRFAKHGELDFCYEASCYATTSTASSPRWAIAARS